MVISRFLGLWLRLMVACCLVVGTARAEPQAAQKALGFSNLVFRPAGGDQVGIAGAKAAAPTPT